MTTPIYIKFGCNIIVALAAFFTAPVLILFQFDPAAAREGAVFTLYIIPALFIEGFSICIGTYMSAFQNPLWPTVISTVCAWYTLHLSNNFAVFYEFTS